MVKHLQTTKRLLVLLLALFCGMQMGWAYDFSAVCPTGQTVYYTITDATNYHVEVTCPGTNSQPWNGYTKPTGELVIPLTVENGRVTYTITSIGSYAFSGCSGLTLVTIGDSVTSIRIYAFSGCSGLTSVTIGNSVTSIGDYAFYGCIGLTSVTIGNSVTSIGDYAFYDCNGLTSVTIGNSVTSISNGVFSNCSGLTSVEIPNSVTSIGNNAFQNCSGLTSVEIPNSVTSIGNNAFLNCSGLTSVTIGTSVTSIGERAFFRCGGLTLVYYTGSVAQWCGITFANSYSNPIYYAHNLYISNSLVTDLSIPASVTSIRDYAFSGCSGLTSVTIGNSVTSIGNNAFHSCSGLTSVEIPNSVTSIGNYAFYGCSGLTSVTIGNSVTSIGERAFRSCSGLTSVTIGNSVTSIGDGAFDGCNGLTLVYYTGSVAQWCGITFANFYSNPVFYARNLYINNALVTDLSIPASVTSIGDYAFYYCSGLTSVTIGNSVTSIGNYAFYGCSGLNLVYYTGSVAQWCGITFADSSSNPVYYAHNLYISNALVTDLSIPASVTSIGNYAFCYCSGLTSVEIPNSVTTIGNYAFFCCSALTSVEIPNSVTSIGNYAFHHCFSLTSIEIPNSVTTIGAYAFAYCSGLTSVIIPNSMTSIGNAAFYVCSGLTSITSYATTPPTLGTSVFYNVPTTAIVYVPCSISDIYKATSGWNYFSDYEEIYMGDFCPIIFADANVEAICVAHWDTNGDGGLSYAEAAMVTDLGTFFKSDSTITSFDELEYFTGLASLPNSAFMSCTCLASISLPASLASLGTGALFNCSGLTTISVYAETPPSLSDNALGNVPVTVTIIVPCGTSDAYQAASGWSNFSNVVEMCTYHFTIPGDWSVANNWVERVVPGIAAEVFINANCQLSTDATVDQLTISSGKMLTVNSGAVLTVSNTLTNNGGSAANLIIADGGQLINPNCGVNGTLKKHISGYGTGDDGWFTIAAPIYYGMQVNSLAAGTYDLYYYDEPTQYWRNQKNSTNDFTTLNLGQGYLYANMQNKDLSFAGQLNASDAVISVPVTCEGGVLAGFNLVGNPYTNNIGITDVKVNGAAQEAYYRAEGGNNLMAYVDEDNEPIKPGQGFFVKVTESGTLTFGDASASGGSPGENGYVRLTLSKDGQVVDRAFLCMSDGQTLEKVNLSNAHSQLYFKNGNGRYAVAVNEAVNDVMPLCLEKAWGTYTIDASLLNVECGYLHLIDNLNGANIDLLETPSYTFEAVPGDDASRFKLVFDFRHP